MTTLGMRLAQHILLETPRPKEAALLIRWFCNIPLNERNNTIVHAFCLLMLRDVDCNQPISQVTMEHYWALAGGECNASIANHFDVTRAHRYGHHTTDAPPFVRDATGWYHLNPIVKRALQKSRHVKEDELCVDDTDAWIANRRTFRKPR